MKYFILILLFFVVTNCDTSKKKTDGLDVQIACNLLATCNNQRSVKFGILGDSWTDLVFGTDVIDSLRVQLEKIHGYNLVGSTIGGQQLSKVYEQGLHYYVIDQAGPSIQYMILSLGGNDIQANPANYLNNVENEKQNRFSQIRDNLFNLMRTGNIYKINKYGGGPLTWIIHGYDYTNPDMATSFPCRANLVSQGFTSSEVPAFQQNLLDSYNDYIKSLTFQDAQLRYIDLRGTLNGPPSKAEYMYDCIHPNSIGFRILGEKYVKFLQGYTNNER
jgi:hypothetical protein